MKTLARWNPFRELAPFTSFPEMDTMFGEFPFRPMMGGFEPMPAMRVDVTESDTAFTVKAEIPGMKKEDIDVSVDGNTLSIMAEAKREKDVKEGEKMLRCERYYGAVSRMLTLPVDVDLAKADAKYEGGVLTLMLPKAAGAEVRKLEVH